MILEDLLNKATDVFGPERSITITPDEGLKIAYLNEHNDLCWQGWGHYTDFMKENKDG